MGLSYLNEFRVRVIRIVEKGAAARTAARRFEIGDSAAIRWVKRWRETGRPRSTPSRARAAHRSSGTKTGCFNLAQQEPI